MKKKDFSKRTIKKILAAGFILSCTLQFPGCGSKENTESKQEIQNDTIESDFVYTAERQEIKINGSLGAADLLNDTIYFLSGEAYGENGEYRRQAYSLKTGLEEATPTPLPITLEAGESIEHLCVDQKGDAFAVVNQDTKLGGNSSQKMYFLNRYTADGNIVFSVDITELHNGDAYFSIRYMAVDREDNIYLSSNGSVNDFSTIWIFDGEGNRTGKLLCETWVEAMFMLPDGKVAAAMREGENGGNFKEIEAATGTFKKTYGNLPEPGRYFAGASDHTILMTGKDKVYQYDLTTETYEELFRFRDCDVEMSRLCGFGVLSDGRILAVCQSAGSENPGAELVYLTKKTRAEAAEDAKETIVLGVMFFGNAGMSDAVLRFNQTNEQYRIEVVSYGEEDYEAGKMRLDAELVSESGPDIVWMNYSDMKSYAKQGILEDLYSYIDMEEAMDRGDFVESVLAAFETDGKLHCFSPDFSVDTMIGKSADVGKEAGWTIEDVIALAESKPEGTELFEYGTKSRVLESFFYGSMERFINWETGECSFNDGTFEKLLIFADRFPKEILFDEEESTAGKFRDGRILLAATPVAGVDTLQMYEQLFGEPVTLIGYPSDEGAGSYILPAGPAIGINVNSKHKEAAWDFVKQLLSLEYQTERAKVSFPILKVALEAKFEENMTPEYREINGEQIEQPKVEVGYGDWNGKLYVATEEEINAVRTLIEYADGITTLPQEVSNMVLEEAETFFEGQKSAREVADIIQSRVQIYVNENR